MQQSLSSFCLAVSDPGSVFSHPGQLRERMEKPLLEAHQMQKLGHSVPDSSQAPAASQGLYFTSLQHHTLAFRSHAADAFAD